MAKFSQVLIKILYFASLMLVSNCFAIPSTSTLEINHAISPMYYPGLALVLLGIVFVIAEAFIGSFGLTLTVEPLIDSENKS